MKTKTDDLQVQGGQSEDEDQPETILRRKYS